MPQAPSPVRVRSKCRMMAARVAASRDRPDDALDDDVLGRDHRAPDHLALPVAALPLERQQMGDGSVERRGQRQPGGAGTASPPYPAAAGFRARQ